MFQLKRIEIHGPKNFAQNIDDYLNGETVGK